MLDFSILNSTSTSPTIWAALYAYMLAFIIGSFIALTYIKTFRGLSYSRNFVHCLVFGPIITALTMQAIGDNVARGIGIMGAISLLRFRTNIKDPRDMFFIFAALACGLACGVQSFALASVGCLSFIATAWILSMTPFAIETHFDGLLKLNVEKTETDSAKLKEILTDFCQASTLVTIRELAQGDRLDYTYQIKMKPNKETFEMVRRLQEIPSARSVNVLMQESIIEL